MHTAWSDGPSSVGEWPKRRKPEAISILLVPITPRSRIAGGMDEVKLSNQLREIEHVTADSALQVFRYRFCGPSK